MVSQLPSCQGEGLACIVVGGGEAIDPSLRTTSSIQCLRKKAPIESVDRVDVAAATVR